MFRRLLASLLSLSLLAAACGEDHGTTLTIYSGRKQEIVEPLFHQFEETSGIELDIRYADSIDLAATLREEGSHSPADVFFSVDPASLGAVAAAGMLRPLPQDILGKVPDRFSDSAGLWVGTSGRSRSVVYDSSLIEATDLPSDLRGFTEPEWRGRLGIAPSNGSFIASVATMILVDGETATRMWLEGIAANDPSSYPKNSVIVAAVERGESVAGLVNHYYLLRFQEEVGETVAANHFLSGGAGALVMPAGAGIISTTDNVEAAEQFVRFLLSGPAQRFFAEQAFEYPMIEGADPHPALPPLDGLHSPEIDLSDLAEFLDAATDLIAEAGLL